MDKTLRVATHIQLLKQKDYGLLQDILLLEQSSLFDPDYYLKQYPAIAENGIDPYYHYCLYGWRDGLEPSPNFSCQGYLKLNPDVQGNNPIVHYLRYGKKENRLSINPNVTPNVVQEIQRLQSCSREESAASIGELPTVTVPELLNKRFRGIQPLNICMAPGKNASGKLIFVTDALGKSLLGGVGTALLLASQYAIRKKMDLCIVTRMDPPNPNSYFDFMKMMRQPTPKEVTCYSDHDRGEDGKKDYKLEVSSNDEFFTTSWWSTKSVLNNELSNKIFYIIQEVEPFFYPYDDDHFLCSELMNETENVSYIVNSHYLWEYFQKNYPNIVKHGIFFEPAFPTFLYKSNLIKPAKRKYSLFFYAREKGCSRNLFYFGLRVLQKAVDEGIFTRKDWEIYFAGQSLDYKIDFGDGFQPLSLGKMSWDKYAEFLGSIDLTFSLMYTPHPSYPPLDTIASGGVCVTNSFENKTSCEWCKNLIFSELSEKALLNGLRKGTALAKNMPERSKNYQSRTLPDSWDKVFDPVLAFMEKF